MTNTHNQSGGQSSITCLRAWIFGASPARSRSASLAWLGRRHVTSKGAESALLPTRTSCMAIPKLFTTTRLDEVLIVSLLTAVGGLDWQRLQSELDDAGSQLRSDGPRHVLIDFNQSRYFDSCMLAGILHLTRLARGCHGRLAMCNVSTEARQILELARFDLLGPICDTRAAAIAALRENLDPDIS